MHEIGIDEEELETLEKPEKCPCPCQFFLKVFGNSVISSQFIELIFSILKEFEANFKLIKIELRAVTPP